MNDSYIYYKNKKIFYSIKGKGYPLVFIHGLNLDSKMVDKIILKESLLNKQIISIDLPGYGESEFIEDLSIEDVDIIISMLVSSLNINVFELMGFCLGGIFSLDYAIKYPEKISHLYLIETMIYLPKWMNICMLSSFKHFYAFLNENKLFNVVLGSFSCFNGLNRNERIIATSKQWNYKVNAHYISIMKEYQKINHLKRCEKITCLTELIYCGKSFKQVKKSNIELAKKIKKSKKIIFEDNNHFDFIM